MTRPPRRLHGALFWLLALAAVVLVACYLTRPVHALLVDLGWMADDDRNFLRVFRRLLLIPLAILFLWRVRPWQDGIARPYGLLRPQARLRPALLGFALTVLALVGVLAWQMQQGWLRFEEPLRFGEFARRVAIYVVGGLTVGILEEWFFRGWLVRRATADLGPRMGTLLAAALFGLVHAFRPSTLDHAISHDAAGAWDALRSWTALALDPTAFGPAAFGLLCFALLLSAAYARTGTLWTSIGIHAGAVLVLFSYGALTERAPGPEWSGTRLLYDGLVVQALAVGAALWLYLGRPKPAATAAPPEG